MSRFHDLRVAEVRPETANAKVVTFDIPAELKDLYRYVPGQYLTVEVELNGEKYRRAYSICTSYLAGEPLGIGVKRVDDGVVSTYINARLFAGSTLRVMTPMGNFIHQPDSALRKQYVFFGGGSGITPLMSLLKSTLLGEPMSRITLIYCNRNIESIMFRAELENWVNRYPDRLKVIHNLDLAPAGWGGHSGMFSKAVALSFLNQYVQGEADYYICGPGGMMNEIDAALAEKGVAKQHIFKEFFTAPLQMDGEIKETIAVSSEGIVSDKPLPHAELVVTIDGDQFTITYDGEESLLEAALEKGLDPPYACQIGACCTCRAKIKEGKVVMAERESLSDSEIEEGYVLTCQSKPLTKKVVYTYDE
ncbi:MAG: ferredoxin--NADP reductase [Chitinophagales bacterium]|nr:ferredoxin--NADP reductase [Chitinophagales bacterium]